MCGERNQLNDILLRTGQNSRLVLRLLEWTLNINVTAESSHVSDYTLLWLPLYLKSKLWDQLVSFMKLRMLLLIRRNRK